MQLEDIYDYFRDPSPIYLTQELSVCYILSVLLEAESYGTELVRRLEDEYPPYRLSDTVLYEALNFLEEENCIISYGKKVEGRGRPCRMLQLTQNGRQKADELAKLWQDYTAKSPSLLS